MKTVKRYICRCGHLDGDHVRWALLTDCLVPSCTCDAYEPVERVSQVY